MELAVGDDLAGAVEPQECLTCTIRDSILSDGPGSIAFALPPHSVILVRLE